MRNEPQPNDASNVVTVSYPVEKKSNADGLIASLFSTTSGNQKREADAVGIRAKAKLDEALAARLATMESGSGKISTTAMVIIGVGSLAVIIAIIALVKKK